MNENLHKAAKNKNDEFYTRLIDIEQELNHYISEFDGKKILLPCNDYGNNTDNFWQYFYNNFDNFNLEQLVAVHYSNNTQSYIVSVDKNNKTPNIIQLQENGDFRSDEVKQLIQAADIIITNPPFSLFRQLVVLLEQYQKKYILIGNENTVASTEIFPLIKDDKIRMGYNKVKLFNTPDGSTKTFGNISWFTNFHINKVLPLLKLKAIYLPEKYPKYDNFDAINVDKVSDIPKDYFGVMGIPISYLNKYNPAQFKILGLAAGNTKTHKLNYSVPYTPNTLDRGGCGVINGVRKYSRVFVERVK